MAGRGFQIQIGADVSQLARDRRVIVAEVLGAAKDAEKAFKAETKDMFSEMEREAKRVRESLSVVRPAAPRPSISAPSPSLRDSASAGALGWSAGGGASVGGSLGLPPVDPKNAAELLRQAAAVDALRASMDPLYAATLRYDAAVEQVNAAVAAGAIDQKRANAVLEIAEAQFKQTAAAARGLDAAEEAVGGLGARMTALKPAIQNASYQIQDFAVQVAAGGSATTALTQQLPQLLGSFGLFGAVAGAAAAVLLPLAANILFTGEEAETAEDRIEKLRDAINAYVDAADAARAPTAELEERYGRMAGAAREALNAQADLNRDNALRALADDADALGASLKVVEDMVPRVLGAFAAAGSVRSGQANATTAYQDAIEELADSLEISTPAAEDLYAALQRLMQAEGPDAIAQGYEDARDALKAATDEAGTMNEEAGKLEASLNEGSLAVADLIGKMEAGPNILKEMQNAASGLTTAVSGLGEMFAGWLPALREAAGLLTTAAERGMDARIQYQNSRVAGVSAAGAANKDALVSAVAQAAQAAGLDPAIVLAVMGVESGWNPGAVGGAGGNYQGLIQFGPNERQTYDVSADSDIATQVAAAVKFLIDRGVRPGDDPARYYAAVLAGNADAVNAGDTGNGGRVANITDFVQGDDFQTWLAQSQRELGARGLGGSPYDGVADAAQEAATADREAEQAREQAAKKAADEAQRQLDIRGDLIAQSQQMTDDAAFEATLVGQSAEAQASLRAEYLLTNQAKAQGISLTETIAGSEETYGQMIQRTAAAIGAATVAEQQRTAALEVAAERQAQLEGVASTVASSLTDGLMDAVTGAQSFGDAMRGAISSILADLARLIIQQTIYNALAGAMGVPGGGNTAGSLLSLFGGARASGGPVSGGKTYLVGENGPELFRAPTSGTIVPNHQLVRPNFTGMEGMGGRGQGGASQVTVTPHIEVHNILGDADVARMLSKPSSIAVINRIMEREGYQRG